MPQILKLVSRLFTKDFGQRYAEIREKVNAYFKQYTR